MPGCEGAAGTSLPANVHSTSIAARQNSGMPIASGNSAAFHCQPFAAKTA